jgi:hypothetical protein
MQYPDLAALGSYGFSRQEFVGDTACDTARCAACRAWSSFYLLSDWTLALQDLDPNLRTDQTKRS